MKPIARNIAGEVETLLHSIWLQLQFKKTIGAIGCPEIRKSMLFIQTSDTFKSSSSKQQAALPKLELSSTFQEDFNTAGLQLCCNQMTVQTGVPVNIRE